MPDEKVRVFIDFLKDFLLRQFLAILKVVRKTGSEVGSLHIELLAGEPDQVHADKTYTCKRNSFQHDKLVFIDLIWLF